MLVTDRIQYRQYFPGIAVALVVSVLAMLIAPWVSPLSPLLITMLAGIAWRNLFPVPEQLMPGNAIVEKPILRFGIVLLGLQIAAGDIINLGWIPLLGIVAAVVITFTVTMAAGRRLEVDRRLRMLIASGFSICGAAAVAGARSVTDADEDDTATAVALVVIFGTIMIPAGPALAVLFGMDAKTAGLFIGLTTHEVAQVVAAGGIVGATALAVAIVVKLGRVLLLAPVMAALGLLNRHELPDTGRKRPPLVPYFVLGFIACVVIRSLDLLPQPALDTAAFIQTAALAMAMFALGLNVHLRSIVKLGPRPAILGAIATATIIIVGLVTSTLTMHLAS